MGSLFPRSARFSRKTRLAPQLMLPVILLFSQLPFPTCAQTDAATPVATASLLPSNLPSLSLQPSAQPSAQPSGRPSLSSQPSSEPSGHPSNSIKTRTTQTWASIRVTFFISLATMILLLTLYEVGRRIPVLRDIYDRKRETRPGRTPPKMLSGAGKGRCSWFRSLGRLLECLFVDGYVDEAYTSFAAEQTAAAKKSQRSSEASGVKDNELSCNYGESESGKNVSSRESNVDIGGADLSKFQTNNAKAHRAPFSDVEEAESRLNSELASIEHGSCEGSVDRQIGDQIESEEKARDTFSHEEEAEERINCGLESGEDGSGEGSADARKSEGLDPTKPPLPVQEGEGGKASIKSETIAQQKLECVGADEPLKVIHDATARGDETKAANTAEIDPAPSRWSFFWIRAGSTLLKKDVGNDDPAAAARYFAVPLYFRWMLHLPLLKPAPIPESDRKLLRCIGLDSYVMIRFLRLGFEVTFYPFLFFCVTLIPLYHTSDYEGDFAIDEKGAFLTTVVNGYYSITINHLEAGSQKLWAVCVISMLYYKFVFRRLWVEWKVFVEFRKDFQAQGDPDAVKEDDGESLRQYQNSCLVEYIPSSHRRDKDIYLFYNTIFPGQVRRAEALLESEELTKLIEKRERLIELYENAQARYAHNKMVYERRLESFEKGEKSIVGCAKRKPEEPVEPKVRVSKKCCGGEEVLALPHYLSQIEELNSLVEDEYDMIVQRKEDSERDSCVGDQDHVSLKPDAPRPRELQDWNDLEKYLYKIFVPPVVEAPPLGNCGNAFVEFRTRSIKQAALQCNLTGKAGYFDTFAAPDPRDLVWENATIERTTTKRLLFYVECLLIVGILFWAALVSAIGNIPKIIEESGYDPNGTLLGFIGGFLPPLTLNIIMAILPIIFNVLGVNVIRFKARSKVDKFTMKWNFCYRLANFLAVLISGPLYDTLIKPEEAVNVLSTLANAVLLQSQFFMNLVLIVIGSGLMIQLSQLWSVLYWILVRSICTLEGMSEHGLQRMKEPKWFIFGRFAPEFVYILMIGIVYSTMVPLIIGACSLYFFVASKVYTHQALFVFSQRYEGGGKLMYTVTRIVFIVIYASILIFGVVLSLKEVRAASATFLVLMLAMAIYYDLKIDREFIRPSSTLPLTRARILDEEYTSLLERKTGDLCEEAGPAASLTSEIGVTRSSLLPNAFVGDRRKVLAQDQDLKSFRGSSASGAGMGIGQPRLFGKQGSTDANFDYYLYRQPHLNKATWETKPRPYRSNIGEK